MKSLKRIVFPFSIFHLTIVQHTIKKKLSIRDRTNKGQSLFEVVFTIGIAAIIIVAVVALATKSIGNSTSATDSAQATRYSEQITECLRQKRDADWDAFVSTGASSCSGIIPGGSIFKQTINLTVVSDSEVEALVTVTWSDGSGTHDVATNTTFTDWRRN